MEVLFELIKGLIKDLDGTSDDEVHLPIVTAIEIIIPFCLSNRLFKSLHVFF